MKKLSIITLVAVSMVASLAMAGDVLWFYGHNGFDGEGHDDIQALLEAEGACNAPDYPSQNLLISSTIGQSEKAGGLTCA